MSQISAINKESHRSKTWIPAPNYNFTARDTVLFLGASEVPRLAVKLPLAFLWYEDAYRVVLLVGLEPHLNLLVAPDGTWLETYLPIGLRAYPFCLAPGPTKDELILCFDETYGSIASHQAGNPFFQGDGSLAPKVKQVMDLLVAYQGEKAACDRICAALDAAGLIKPWDLVVQMPTGSRRIEGLHTLDEQRLEELDGEAFLGLRAIGGLTVAYCQMLSTQNVGVLVERARTRLPTAAFSSASSMELDFSRFRT